MFRKPGTIVPPYSRSRSGVGKSRGTSSSEAQQDQRRLSMRLHIGPGARNRARDARFVAASGALLSSDLLVSDLGRPKRFLNMLCVFKPQSAMSVGAWILAGYFSKSERKRHRARRSRWLLALLPTSAATS